MKRPRSFDGALAALFLAAVAGSQGLPEPAASPSSASAPAPAPVDRAVLRAIRALHDPEAPPPEELLRRIAEAGPPPIDDLLRFLERGEIDACFATDDDVDPMDGDVQLMNRYQQKLVLAVLDAVGAEQVQPAIERLLQRAAGPQAVGAAILGTGAIGGAGHLRALFELAEPFRDEQRLHPAVERALEQAVTALLVADPKGFGTLAACWTQIAPAFVPAVVRGVGATADGRGVELLGQILAWSPEHASLAVAQLRRLGPSPDPEINARIADELRARLDPLDPGFCRAAILALAELGDFHAVPRLIELLETAPAVEENALWALQRLTGRNWADSPDWWRSWYAAELDWREQAYPRLSRELSESVRRETLVVALREFGEHRLFRHDLALEVCEVLESRDRPVRLLAVETLEQLGSKAALPALVDLLADEDQAVREAAWRALQALTGETHAVDSPRWAALAAGA